MHLTSLDIPRPLEQALLSRATAESKTVAEALLDAAARGLGVELTAVSENAKQVEASPKKRDLSFLWADGPLEPEVIEALEAQRQIDPEKWK